MATDGGKRRDRAALLFPHACRHRRKLLAVQRRVRHPRQGNRHHLSVAPLCTRLLRQGIQHQEKEGTVLDFQIFFPKLPETTKEICIYGVPNWCMEGQDVYLDNRLFMRDLEASIRYFDEMMPIHKAHLVSEAKDYNKDDHKTWAVYNDAHLIQPVKEDTYAIWRTEEATYLAEACEMNKMREYFKGRGNSILIDQSGHQYKCNEVLDYPNDELFWVKGYSGDYFAIVMVFEPIPLYLENITYIVPKGEPFAMWGANWDGKVLSFNIKELRDNQKLFRYHPREVVK